MCNKVCKYACMYMHIQYIILVAVVVIVVVEVQ